MIRILSFFILTFFLSLKAFPQRDSFFVKSFYEKLIIKPVIGGPNFNLNLTPKGAPDSTRSSYQPNTYGILGIDLAYRAISISLSKKAGQVKDPHVYGKSKYTSLYARLLVKKWVIEGYYKDFKGYADLYTPRYNKMLPPDKPFIIRNDIRTEYYKIKGIYQFNLNKFSYPAAFFHTERQTKSAIAFMMMYTLDHIKMTADSSFFPYRLHPFYKDLQSMNFLSVSGIGVAPGMGFNIVWRKFFFSGLLFLGTELQYQKYYLPALHKWDSRIRMALAEESKFSIGLNGNRAFAAISVKTDVNNMNLLTFRGQTKYTIGTLEFGYRFDAPKGLDKVYHKVGSFLRGLIKKNK